MDDYTRQKLCEWGLSNLTELFEEEEIDKEALECLTPDVIARLVPKVGPQVKLARRVEELKTKNVLLAAGNDFNIAEYSVSDSGTLEPIAIVEENSPNGSSNLQCLTSDGNNQDDTSFSQTEFSAENKQACSKATSSGNNKATSSGSSKATSSGSSKATSSGNSGHEKNFPRTSLPDLLNSTPSGKAVLAVQHNTGGLTEKYRRSLVNIVVADRLQGNVKLKHEDFRQLSLQISELFPKERVETYYIPPVRAGKIQKIARGKLVDKVRNAVRELKVLAAVPTSHTSADLSFEGEAIEETAEVTDTLLWLKNCVEPWAKVVDAWKCTHEHRMRDLKCKEGKITDYFAAYPALRLSLGYTLLEDDFAKLFPDKENAFFRAWPNFCASVIKLLQNKQAKDAKVKDFLAAVKDDLSEDDVALQVILILASIFPTSPTIKLKTRTWRPSRVECQESFAVHLKIAGDIKVAMEQRKVKAASLGLSVQPSVYFVGEETSKIESCYVAVDNVIYKVGTPVKAIDCCFKAFWALNAQYPTESQHIWLVLQKHVYQITSKTDKILTSVNTILSELT